jgi:hypothetical protein
MIIWRGYGAVAIGVVFASSLVANLIANLIRGPRYWETHGWPIAVSFCVDAVVLWLIDVALARRIPQTTIDKATGERTVGNKRHEFFFLRLRWWSLIFAGLAMLVLLTGWAPGPFKP